MHTMIPSDKVTREVSAAAVTGLHSQGGDRSQSSSV